MSTFNRAAVKHLAGLSIVIINKGQREKRFYRISNEKSFVLLNRFALGFFRVYRLILCTKV
ncbi:hypothetical protein D918_04638 [Trichuris suis]|nr:hypothetical protein D918_04638 [Trichuris suis]